MTQRLYCPLSCQPVRWLAPSAHRNTSLAPLAARAAALLAELDRIKTERAEEAARKEADRLEAEALERAEEVAGGNPLLDLRQGAADFTVKRRWDDDVVFKNQTRGEPKSQKRFINDTIRSDFHKRFLNKYIK